jgi:hypothetical protein
VQGATLAHDEIYAGKSKDEILEILPRWAPPSVGSYHQLLAALAVRTATDLETGLAGLAASITQAQAGLATAIHDASHANAKLARVGTWLTGVLAIATVVIAIGTVVLATR